jgi:hypothetical protein
MLALALSGAVLPGYVTATAMASAPATPQEVPQDAPRIEPLPLTDSPAAPLKPNRAGFAQFVRYGQAIAKAPKGAATPLSAMLSDPIALDGQRRRCDEDQQPVAVIDLDPMGDIATLPANPSKQPGLALGLAVLREAGVVIAWVSDMSADESGALRTALELSGLDPRGEDIISLRREQDDRKFLRITNLAGSACIIAIAGDERADFDERFKYLRSPEAGAALEPVIGDGWFLVEPIFPASAQDKEKQSQ